MISGMRVSTASFMKDPRNTFGIPNTLPPLGLREVWNWLWLGFTGILLLALGFFPRLIPPPWGGFLVLVCWLAAGSPFRAQASHCPKAREHTGQATRSSWLVRGRLYPLGEVSVCHGRSLSTLFFIEALPSLMFVDGVVEALDCGPFIWIDDLWARFSFRAGEQDGCLWVGSREHTIRWHFILAGSPT